jgi:hypothetical protein
MHGVWAMALPSAQRFAELRGFAAKKSPTVKNDRESFGCGCAHGIGGRIRQSTNSLFCKSAHCHA